MEPSFHRVPPEERPEEKAHVPSFVFPGSGDCGTGRGELPVADVAVARTRLLDAAGRTREELRHGSQADRD